MGAGRALHRQPVRQRLEPGAHAADAVEVGCSPVVVLAGNAQGQAAEPLGHEERQLVADIVADHDGAAPLEGGRAISVVSAVPFE